MFHPQTKILLRLAGFIFANIGIERMECKIYLSAFCKVAKLSAAGNDVWSFSRISAFRTLVQGSYQLNCTLVTYTMGFVYNFMNEHSEKRTEPSLSAR